MVLADLKGDDIILCQLTSQFIKDNYAIGLDNSDFKKGSLNKPGNIRPNRLFTAEKSIITLRLVRLSMKYLKRLWINFVRLSRIKNPDLTAFLLIINLLKHQY